MEVFNNQIKNLKGIWRLIKKIRKKDICIICGGVPFYDGDRIGRMIYTIIPKIMLKKIYVIGVSYKETKTLLGKIANKIILKLANKIDARDKKSQKSLSKLSNKNVGLVPDSAFYINIETKKRKNKFLLCPRVLSKRVHSKVDYPTDNESIEKMKNLFSKIGDYLSNKGEVIFVPLFFKNDEKELDDLDTIKEIRKRMKNKSKIYNVRNWSIKKLINLFASSKMVVGMRLHSLIFAKLTNTPSIAISHPPKVKNFMETYGLQDSCFELKKTKYKDIEKKLLYFLKKYPLKKNQ